MSNWQKWIVPGIVTVAILTLLSTFFKADVVEKDLTDKASQLLAGSHPWASVELSGRDLTLSGTSPTTEALEQAIQIADSAYDVRVVNNESALLSVASPYVLEGVKEGPSLTVSGNIASEEMRARILEAAKKANPDLTIEDNLTLARGNPDGFVDLGAFALQQLNRFDSGSFEIKDTTLSIKGVASSVDAYEAASAALSGSIPAGGKLDGVEITPPTLSPYEFSADYNGETVTLSGYAPNEDAIDAIGSGFQSALPNAKIANNLRVALGAAAEFKSATDYATAFFPNLASGAAKFFDDQFSITGVSRSSEAFQSAMAHANNLPEGYNLASNTIRPMDADVYNWSISKGDNGISISGLVPDSQAGDEVLAMVKKMTGASDVANNQTFASGEPKGFTKAREFVVDQLANLLSGNGSIVGDKIQITGQAADANARGLVERAVNLRAPAGYSAEANISLPESVVIKGKEIKINEDEPKTEPTAQETCQAGLIAAVDGRKILFDTGKATIKSESLDILDAVVLAANNCDELKIEIGGHTDSTGNEKLNQKLSEARANSVVGYLVNKGVNADNLSAVGYGQTQPIADNETAEGRAANRRIVFNVLK